MKRKTKLMLNSAFSLLHQTITIICGFILPRLFLKHYGSEVNGLLTSITQFLGFITLAECGVGAVVQSTLYRPLAEKDMTSVSRVVISAEKFFRKIAYILLGYVAVLMVIYPFITLDSFDFIFTMLLVAVISINSFAQYYFGMTYRVLLEADQLGFVQYGIHICALLLNTTCCIILMQFGASVIVVKLATSLIFVLQPILLSVIAKRRYAINRTIVLSEEPIKQKWNGLAQHVAGVVLINADTVILTLFSTLNNVSIYAVYHLVVNGLRQIILSATNGIRAMFGNMLAKNEIAALNQTFARVEWLLHMLVTFVFSVAVVLMIPFVRVYTADITDTNYIVPEFAYLITLSQAAYCYRLPYYILVNAAGHYKQTQRSAIVEAVINVVISVILVFRCGLPGVAIGTFAAMAYRTVCLAVYLKKRILHRPLHYFLKHLLVDACGVALLFMIVRAFPVFYTMGHISYIAWFWLAVKVGVTGIAVMLTVNCLFYWKIVKKFVKGKE